MSAESCTPAAPHTSTGSTPPVALRRSTTREHHGDVFVDHYEWLRDKTDPMVIDHLTAENAYAEAVTAHLGELREQLFEDVKARTQETDLSVPVRRTHTDGRAWWYYARTEQGLDYPVYCRIPAGEPDQIPGLDTLDTEQEQVLLDGNAQAAGHPFFSLGALAVSPDGTRLAFSVDRAGDERYDTFVRDIGGAATDDVPAMRGIGAGLAWAGEEHLFYVRVDDAWRACQVWRHRVGSDPADDVLVYDEPDERYWVGVAASGDRRWIVIESSSKLTAQVFLIGTDRPEQPPRPVTQRRDGLDYTVEVIGEQLFILHNARSPDFQISLAHVPGWAPPTGAELAPEHSWEDWVGPTEGVRYTGVDAFTSHVVVSRRRDALAGVQVHPRPGGPACHPGGAAPPHQLTFAEPVYEAGVARNGDVDADRVRLFYESLATPPSVLEYHFGTGQLRTVKSTPVREHPTEGPYDPADYTSERVWATAPDGTRVPVSLVRHRDTELDGTAPCLLYGYGSYETSTDPSFSISRISLLNRGFVYAEAHVRGGGELGRAWYDDGKMLAKKNTFTDFVAVAEWLVDNRYTAADRLVAEGRSAGGMLMGAVTNMAPELFRAVHAGVAFVDCLTTILDPALPLTVPEWEEWGNPLADAEVYAYMKSYTPYENVRPVRYPAILATTSLNDTRVMFTEPAKWVAQLRHTTVADPERPVLLRTEMVAGHGGVTGRYDRWRDRAWELAWIIDQATGHR